MTLDEPQPTGHPVRQAAAVHERRQQVHGVEAESLFGPRGHVGERQHGQGQAREDQGRRKQQVPEGPRPALGGPPPAPGRNESRGVGHEHQAGHDEDVQVDVEGAEQERRPRPDHEPTGSAASEIQGQREQDQPVRREAHVAQQDAAVQRGREEHERREDDEHAVPRQPRLAQGPPRAGCHQQIVEPDPETERVEGKSIARHEELEPGGVERNDVDERGQCPLGNVQRSNLQERPGPGLRGEHVESRQILCRVGDVGLPVAADPAYEARGQEPERPQPGECEYQRQAGDAVGPPRGESRRGRTRTSGDAVEPPRRHARGPSTPGDSAWR